MKYKKWTHATPEGGAVQGLTQMGLPTLAAMVLCARGIDTPELAQGFLAEDHSPLHDPFLLKDMDRAVARITRALEENQSMVVYGDYDVDGITSTCLLTRFLQERGGRVAPYIPDRLEEGYGLSREGINALSTEPVDLIITVDCGITALDEVEYAREKGIEVIITDHHSCKAQLPQAVAVVNPHRPDCNLPFTAIAGVGVALYVALALTPKDQREDVLERYADLATLGTVADVMPLTGPNRTLVRRGLRLLKPSLRPGLTALIHEVGADSREMTATSVGFTLSPRINAAGRMGCARVASELILTHDPDRAAQLAHDLCELNRLRQSIEGEIFQDCQRILERESAQNRSAIVLASDTWHQGVVGIVASRLSERYFCPSFMICIQDGKGKGSCRSFGGVNLFQALEYNAHLLEGFGGHALAAGFTILEEHIPAFRQGIADYMAQCTGGEPLESVLELDGDLGDGSVLTIDQVVGLDRLEPYGAGNHRPVFSLTNCTVTNLSEVGGGRHLKLRVNKGGHLLDGIFFSNTATSAQVALGDRIDLAFVPQINEYRGNRAVQLLITDLRPAQTRVEAEQSLYLRLCTGQVLSAQEAQSLLPQRQEFANLWRYLSGHAQQGQIEDTARHLARNVARVYGTKESLMHTLVGLSVMAEQGLLTLEQTTDHLRIRLHPAPGKVDLEGAPMMVRLRAMAQVPVGR